MEDVIYSKAVRAGKRIYYVDVKKNSKEEMFLSMTESKRVTTGHDEDARVTFEKHKIFLHREDFDKFRAALDEAIAYVEEHQGKAEPRPEGDSEIKLDLEF